LLKRRLCADPKATGESTGRNGCPDIWELEDGSFLVIGADRTEELRHLTGKDLFLDDSERIVVIPRNTLVSAKDSIPGA
jgi:fructose-specific component phosphotransferase system IIB-like protein